MCALFGFVNYGRKISNKNLNKVLRNLSIAAEERGTDATGFGYISPDTGEFIIKKEDKPAHEMKFSFPKDTIAVVGHTRWTTQGDGKYNYNNHPFESKNKKFIMAHNGVIRNDKTLREKHKLPSTVIETDSYIAVQLADSKKDFNFDTLKFVAEELSGTFVLTYLDDKNNLYIVKGDNPIYIVHYKKLGLYVYASTESIFWKGVMGTELECEGSCKSIRLKEGDILKITTTGDVEVAEFECDKFISNNWNFYSSDYRSSYEDDEAYNLLVHIAAKKGLSENEIIYLIECYYFSLYEIADFLFEENGVQELKSIINSM